jgi:hypothetical protein
MSDCEEFFRFERRDTPKFSEVLNGERFIGSDGKPNAYGYVVSVYRVRPGFEIFKDYPVICGHGGSAWLCGTCAEDIMAGRPCKSSEPIPPPNSYDPVTGISMCTFMIRPTWIQAKYPEGK